MTRRNDFPWCEWLTSPMNSLNEASHHSVDHHCVFSFSISLRLNETTKSSWWIPTVKWVINSVYDYSVLSFSHRSIDIIKLIELILSLKWVITNVNDLFISRFSVFRSWISTVESFRLLFLPQVDCNDQSPRMGSTLEVSHWPVWTRLHVFFLLFSVLLESFKTGESLLGISSLKRVFNNVDDHSVLPFFLRPIDTIKLLESIPSSEWVISNADDRFTFCFPRFLRCIATIKSFHAISSFNWMINSFVDHFVVSFSLRSIGTIKVLEWVLPLKWIIDSFEYHLIISFSVSPTSR